MFIAKHTEIKRVLLDQSVASGIRNIYADEALFLAGVHPRRLTDRMSLAKIRAVYLAAIDVMTSAIEAGGVVRLHVRQRQRYFWLFRALIERLTGAPTCLLCVWNSD